MNELKKQNAQLAHLEEDFARYSEQNETMEALIREFGEALAKYENSPKSEQQKLLEQYEDEIINLNHEIEDQSQEAAEVKERIAFYKKLLNISAREEVTLPEPETTQEIPTESAEQPTAEQPPVEQPTVERPPEPTLGIDDDFEHE